MRYVHEPNKDTYLSLKSDFVKRVWTGIQSFACLRIRLNYHEESGFSISGDTIRTHEHSPLELVGLGSSSSMDSFASCKMNGSEMEKEEREEMPLQEEDEPRRSSLP
ncbi:hypothetical protein GmHk_14G041238 [Glycine max]|nr:hypothetical protein GmHk_14G041238 [Glycine max]